MNWKSIQRQLAEQYWEVATKHRKIAESGEDMSANLKVAIVNYLECTKIYREKVWEKKLASALNTLGITYTILANIGDNPTSNLHSALKYHLESSKIRLNKGLTKDLLDSLNNLGIVYLSQSEIGENSSSNLEKACEIFHEVIEINLKNGWSRKSIVNTITNLGYVYIQKSQIGENASLNLRLAAKVFQEVNHVNLDNDWKMGYAQSLCSLGQVLLSQAKIGENPSLNLRAAVRYFKEANQINQGNNCTRDFCGGLNDLASVYLAQAENEENPLENLKEAAILYQEAAQISQDNDWIMYFATNLNNLANVYTTQATIGEKPLESLHLAVKAYQEAAQIRHGNGWIMDLTATLHNLGKAHTLQASFGDNSLKNIQKAVEIYQKVIQISRENSWTFHEAMARTDLGFAYETRAKLPEANDPKNDRRQSIDNYRLALEIFHPEIAPRHCLEASLGLGNFTFQQGDWETAIEGYQAAVKALEQSRTWLPIEQQRQELIQKNFYIYENAIQSAANLKRYGLMVEFAERARSRQIVDLIANNDLYSDGNIPSEVVPLHKCLQAIQTKIDNCYRPTTDNDPSEFKIGTISYRNSYRTLPDNEASLTKLHNLQQEYSTVLSEIRNQNPVIAGQIAIDIIDFNQIPKLLPHEQAAILYCYTTDKETFLIVITPTTTHLHRCPDQGFQPFQSWLNTTWSQAYEAISTASTKAESDRFRQDWQNNINPTLQQVADRLQLNTLIQHPTLHNITELIVVPHLELHQIPWGAIPVENGKFLGDRFTIRSISSCQILSYCTQRKDTPDDELTYGTIENADGSLPGAEFEGRQVSEMFGILDIDRLIGDRATVTNYQNLLNKGIHSILSSHHGVADRNNPLQSALILANGERITTGTLLTSRYPNLREVFLSACETSVGQASIVDDLVTLSTGFISAGANTVISTLWAVSDLSTAFLTIFYYRYRHAGNRPAIALQKAQYKLRTLSGDTIKATYYQELNQHLKNYENLYSDKAHATQNKEQKKTWDSYSSKAGKMRHSLEIMLKESTPFAAPHYWAGFICQGKG